MNKRSEVKSPLDRLVIWWNLQQARRAAKKYSLDFEHGCVFDNQLRNYGQVRSGDIIEVEMISGKTGLYKSEITKWYGNTGQKSWRFEFQGYADNMTKAKENRINIGM